eukprot:SAG22_NODE_1021_length_5998_cov_2.167316_5_plen_117_part_00
MPSLYKIRGARPPWGNASASVGNKTPLPSVFNLFAHEVYEGPWTKRPTTGANVEDMLVVKLEQYLLWTQQDARIVGWNSWHWQSGSPGYSGVTSGESEACRDWSSGYGRSAAASRC